MAVLIRGVLILLSIYLLISIIYMTWVTIYRPEYINRDGEYRFYSYDFSNIKSLIVKLLLFGAFFGFMVVIGMGAYRLLYWIPYLSGPDIDGDWNYTRRLISFLIGAGVGGAVYLQLSQHAHNKHMKNIIDNSDKN